MGKSEVQEYKPAADNTLKRKIKEETEVAAEPVKKIKVEDDAAEETPKKKKKKRKNKENEENGGNVATPEVTTPVKAEVNGANGHDETSPIVNGAGDTESAKKKKKKKKNKEATE